MAHAGSGVRHLEIDGRHLEVLPECTLLDAAREHGIEIPTLCAHEALLPYGACRLCLVELVGPRGSKLVSACTYPCEEGLVVRTESELVLETRRTVVELLLAFASHLAPVRALAADMNVVAPYIALESSDCILCGRCVRACREIVGVGAIGMTQRGMERRVSTPFDIASSECIECGTCALVCPTGARRVEEITHPVRTVHSWESPYIRGACRLCENEPPALPGQTGPRVAG